LDRDDPAGEEGWYVYFPFSGGWAEVMVWDGIEDRMGAWGVCHIEEEWERGGRMIGS
jgi:hypothetical protein